MSRAAEGIEESEEQAQWAKLRMAEFEALPEYETIKEAIDSKLAEQKIEHDFFTDQEGRDFLLFRVADAPDVSHAFEDLEEQTDRAVDKGASRSGGSPARTSRRQSLWRNVPPQRARHPRALDEARSPDRDIELSEVRSK